MQITFLLWGFASHFQKRTGLQQSVVTPLQQSPAQGIQGKEEAGLGPARALIPLAFLPLGQNCQPSTELAQPSLGSESFSPGS